MRAEIMNFEESEDGIIEFEMPQRSFIYFLIKDGEVAYVGKTKLGLGRPFQHSADKVFDHVKILPCDESELDELECFYIAKYKPEFNRYMGAGAYYRLAVAKRMVREAGYGDYTIWALKKDVKRLGIELENFNGNTYISKNDLDEILRSHKREDKK